MGPKRGALRPPRPSSGASRTSSGGACKTAAASASERSGAAKMSQRVGAVMNKPVPEKSASACIDRKIEELADWRGTMLATLREIVHQADPEIVEEWKW